MTDFTPGTWAGLRPTHRQIPETVTAARAAVEAAWKRRDDMIERYYYAEEERPLVVTLLQIDDAEQEALRLEAAAAVAWREWGIPSSDDDDRPRIEDFI